LEELDISFNELGDKDAVQLADLPKLIKLDLSKYGASLGGNRVSPGLISELRVNLPRDTIKA